MCGELKRGIFCILLVFLISSLVAQDASRYKSHENLGKAVNSIYDEQLPILNPEGDMLFFVRSGHPANIGGKKDKGDIWYSIKSDSGSWSPAKNLGAPWNTSERDGVLGFSSDGALMYLKNIYQNNGKSSTQGISIAGRKGNNWTSPEKISMKYFRNSSDDLSAALSSDGNVMILSMESFVSYGAEDLYVSFKESPTSWSEPRNLGESINSKYQEITPFLSADNSLLFFSSNSYDGYGSKDIYVSERQDDTWRNWSTPQNLGPGINTEGMESSFYLPYGADYAFLISTKNSDGYGDINRVDQIPIDSLEELNKKPQIEEKKPVLVELKAVESNAKVAISGNITNAKNGNPVQALITYEKIPELFKLNVSNSSAEDGSYEVSLDSNIEYLVKVSAKGYMTTEERLILSSVNDARLKMNYSVEPLEVGTTIALKNVFFERGKAVLLDSSYVELDLLVDIMRENPSLKIELSGHTDNRGSSKLNLLLSKDRVAVVKKYLTDRGIVKNRIAGQGYGGSNPVAPNDSEENRRLNRRVEFTVTKN